MGDSIFIFVLALMLFGPKRLPELARQLGKLMGELRRASNDFRMQMEDELRTSEQADRQKQIAAIEAAAPVQALPEPEHPHTPPAYDAHAATGSDVLTGDQAPASNDATQPLPIATSGNLNMMPPATGLPIANDTHSPASSSGSAAESGALSPLLSSIPEAVDPAIEIPPQRSSAHDLPRDKDPDDLPVSSSGRAPEPTRLSHAVHETEAADKTEAAQETEAVHG